MYKVYYAEVTSQKQYNYNTLNKHKPCINTRK